MPSAVAGGVVENCWAPVGLEEPLITYADARVYLELRHTRERNEGEWGGCLLSLLILDTKVSFERDLDELVIFDSSTDPPQQRWPRPRLPDE